MPYCFHNNTDSWWRYVSQTNTDVFKSVASLEEEGTDVKDVGGGCCPLTPSSRLLI